jgi:hypothetical protein
MTKAVGISQDSVSRLEKRSDLLPSTLRRTGGAMSGSLSLVAEFRDRAPVVLSGIAEHDQGRKPTGQRRPMCALSAVISIPARSRLNKIVLACGL